MKIDDDNVMAVVKVVCDQHHEKFLEKRKSMEVNEFPQFTSPQMNDDELDDL